MKTPIRFACLAILCCLPMTAFAQTWTSVCSTGAVDEGSLNRFGFFGAQFGYRASTTSTQPVWERINVVNTFDNNTPPFFPGWTTFELGYTLTASADIINATLYRVDPCTGAQSTVCSVSQVFGATCNVCSIPTSFLPIDFGKYLYYIGVKVDRASANDQPFCNTLRLY